MNVKTCYFSCKRHVFSGRPSYESAHRVRKLGLGPMHQMKLILIQYLNPRQRQTDVGHRMASLPNWQMSKSLLSVLMGKHILFNWGQVLWEQILQRWKGGFSGGFYVWWLLTGQRGVWVWVCVCVCTLVCTHGVNNYPILGSLPIFSPFSSLLFNPLFL